MGAWGVKNFENDDAADLFHEVNEAGIVKLYEKINYVVKLSDKDYLDSGEASEALGAIEYIAASKGNPSSDITQEAYDWSKGKNFSSFSKGKSNKIDMIKLSQKAIHRIITNSELQELWKESEEYNDWLAIVKDLEKRITCKRVSELQKNTGNSTTKKNIFIKRKDIEEGDIINISKNINAKILFKSKIYKDVILIYMYYKNDPTKFDGKNLYYTGLMPILEKQWSKIGSSKLEESERKLSLRIIASDVYLGDNWVRKATKKDHRLLPEMLVDGPALIEKRASELREKTRNLTIKKNIFLFIMIIFICGKIYSLIQNEYELESNIFMKEYLYSNSIT